MTKLFIVKMVGVILALLVAPYALSVDTAVPALNAACWFTGIVSLFGGCILTFRSTLYNGKLYIW